MLDEVAHELSGWQAGMKLDVNAAMLRLALAIVGRALFGADTRDSAAALEASLAQAMRVVSWLGPILEVVPPWVNRLRLRLPVPANAQLAHARREMAAVIEQVIATRRTADTIGGDLLTLLLSTRDAAGAALSTQMIADELVTVLLAGHETTANALSWAWYLLARHPDIEAKLLAEVAAATADHGTLHGVDLARLPFTAAVFAEALRLYPPASAFGRRALEACVLGGYGIAPGDGIMLSPYVSHRNPEIFADPHAFAPQRWLEKAPPPFAYFPFGGGSRLCIGEGFARMEGTLILAAVAQRFTLRATDPEPIGIAAHATLRPARPIILRVSPR
jgi:cytochrome P450